MSLPFWTKVSNRLSWLYFLPANLTSRMPSPDSEYSFSNCSLMLCFVGKRSWYLDGRLLKRDYLFLNRQQVRSFWTCGACDW